VLFSPSTIQLSLLTFAIGLLGISSARAATLDVSSGQPLGAFDVNVGGMDRGYGELARDH
jgi:hypothetical protein